MASPQNTNYLMLKPNEKEEQSRLSLQDQVWALTLNDRLYSVPFTSEPKSVLDIGCGSGNWVLALSKEHPGAQIIGADLNPPSIEVPPNVTFTKWDAEKDWQFARHFSFIHCRMLTSAIRDWPTLHRRSWDHLEPGGWLELQDICPPYRAELSEVDNPTSSPFIQLGHVTDKGWSLNGIDWGTTHTRTQKLKDLGFVNVREQQFRWPLGEWAQSERERQIGALTLQNFLQFLDVVALNVLKQDPSIDEQKRHDVRDGAYKDLIENGMTHRYYFIV